MKKVLAIAAVLVMMPLAAFAKTAVSDSELGAVTGQAGVTIALDVTIPTLDIGVVALGDSDGAVNAVLDPASAAGFVGLTDVAGRDIYVGLDLAQLGNPALLTVDIATVGPDTTPGLAPPSDGLYADLGFAGATYVAIGLPTAIVKVGSLDASVQLGATNALGTELVSLHIADLSLTIGKNSQGIGHPLDGQQSFIHIFAH